MFHFLCGYNLFVNWYNIVVMPQKGTEHGKTPALTIPVGFLTETFWEKPPTKHKSRIIMNTVNSVVNITQGAHLI